MEGKTWWVNLTIWLNLDQTLEGTSRDGSKIKQGLPKVEALNIDGRLKFLTWAGGQLKLAARTLVSIVGLIGLGLRSGADA
jgi:hypothetical protein